MQIKGMFDVMQPNSLFIAGNTCLCLQYTSDIKLTFHQLRIHNFGMKHNPDITLPTFMKPHHGFHGSWYSPSGRLTQ